MSKADLFGQPETVPSSERPKRIIVGDRDKYFEQALKLKKDTDLKIPINTTDDTVFNSVCNGMNTRLSNLTKEKRGREHEKWQKIHIHRDVKNKCIYLFLGEPRKRRNK